jgi:polyisoprenoid-binding protein YceI
MRTFIGLLFAAFGATASAAPVTYAVDSTHTYPSFEADHFGGMSVWRGKFNSTTGSIVLDKEAKTGTVDISIDSASIDSGNEKLNEHLKGPDFFEVAKFPAATYKGKFSKFKDGVPTEVQGELTIRGVTRPVTLTIGTFKCMPHPMKKKEFCGADVTATIDREQFGISFGKQLGFDMKVKLAIQVEANIAG